MSIYKDRYKRDLKVLQGPVEAVKWEDVDQILSEEEKRTFVMGRPDLDYSGWYIYKNNRGLIGASHQDEFEKFYELVEIV